MIIRIFYYKAAKITFYSEILKILESIKLPIFVLKISRDVL